MGLPICVGISDVLKTSLTPTGTPQSAPAPKAPAKTEQPGTAAGGQSSGAVVGAETGTLGGVSLATVAVVAGAVAAVAVVANNTKSTTSH